MKNGTCESGEILYRFGDVMAQMLKFAKNGHPSPIPFNGFFGAGVIPLEF